LRREAFCQFERKKKVKTIRALPTVREQSPHALRVGADARAHRLLGEPA